MCWKSNFSHCHIKLFLCVYKIFSSTSSLACWSTHTHTRTHSHSIYNYEVCQLKVPRFCHLEHDHKCRVFCRMTPMTPMPNGSGICHNEQLQIQLNYSYITPPPSLSFSLPLSSAFCSATKTKLLQQFRVLYCSIKSFTINRNPNVFLYAPIKIV